MHGKQRNQLARLTARVQEAIIASEGGYYLEVLGDFEDDLARSPEAQRIQVCKKYLKHYRRLSREARSCKTY